MRRVPISLVFVLLALVRPSMQGPAPAGQPAVPGQFVLEPVGDVIRTADGAVAEGSLPVAFVRSPDDTGPDHGGRYLIAVNSGYGVQLNARSNEGQQLLQVIDLAAQPAPTVVQTVYFPTPQSVNVGVAFGRKADSAGAWPLYASGGVQDRVWLFTFTPGAAAPLSPGNDASGKPVSAPSISLSSVAPGSRVKVDRAAPGLLYPTGLAVSASGQQLFVANNLADSLAVVPVAPGRRIRTIPLSVSARQHTFVYPYDVVTIGSGLKEKVFVSLWNESAVAVVDPRRFVVKRRIKTGAHPGALLASGDGRHLFVACANTDTVSVIDTTAEREIERIPVGLRGADMSGNSAQALALDASGRTLFVGNAQSASVAVVRLGDAALDTRARDADDAPGDNDEASRSRVAGYIPTARYPSALAVVSGHLFVGNGKGEPPARPNAPTPDFPPNDKLRGAYSVSLMRSSIRRVALPDGSELATMTAAVMRANGLIGPPVTALFSGPSPISHVIYVIKENRTYDQMLGDVPASGDGTPADGAPELALFGSGDAARKHRDVPQSIAANHRALALRFGLFDRFFVNAEASADGHNWSTAAYSSDYVDKAFRLNYSGRGRTYDYEGFNRLPDYEPPSALPPLLRLPVTAADVVRFMRGFVPYLNAQRDVAEPDSLYIWDAAAKAGLTYRSYGEFVGTMSAADVDALNARRRKTYPDISPTVAALPTKRALEAEHHSDTFRAFDMFTPDAFTPDSYRAARAGGVDSVIRLNHPDARFRGTSRLGAWLDDFERFVADLNAGQGDHLPALTILRFPNDHTNGLRNGHATPQFMVADNDYAVGRLVEAVSHSPYWKSTAIVMVEDDAQDGPDHVDAHRSPVLVVSAWNRPGQLVHAIHNTVSLIRTIELLLGIAPMHQLDAAAVPMDVFRNEPDLTPYNAVLPNVADDNLIFTRPRNAQDRYYVDQTARQDLQNADMADPHMLNKIIWYSVRGDQPMPEPARWAGADALQSGLDEAGELANSDPLARARLALAQAVERAHKTRGAAAR
jgi:YVTN family beta-propeller protein